MHIALKRAARVLPFALSLPAPLAAVTSARAETAYIPQVTGRTGPMTMTQSNQLSNPVSTPYGSRPGSFVPAPGIASPARNGNFAQTVQIGNFNQVGQFQSGQSNLSNVGVIGGQNNNVGVWQGGHDLSNLYLVNTQGLSIGVLQPAGSAPVNMLIARLPNGGLLIKR